MSLIEAIVALAILGLVSSAFAAGMNLALRTTRDDRMRQQATHLAEREIEIARNQFRTLSDAGEAALVDTGQMINRNPLTGGARTTDGPAITVDGTPFTVTRQNNLNFGNGASACEGSGLVDYVSMSVNVSVSWTNTGQAGAVQNNTILTPTKGVSSTVGYLGVKLVNAAGTGTSSVPVVAVGPGGSKTRYTAADGCAVFQFDAAGSYTVTLNSGGYVNPDGLQTVNATGTVELGRVNVVTMSYDRATQLRVTFATASGNDLPESLPALTISNSGLAGAAARLFFPTTANPTELSGLWPFASGYSVWAGSCTGSDPATQTIPPANTSNYPRPVAVVGAPGATAEVTAYLTPVNLTVVAGPDTASPGSGVGGVTLIARPADTTGCLSQDVALTLGTTSGAGSLSTSLPSGSWSIEPALTSPAGSVTCSTTATCPLLTGPVSVVTSTGERPSSSDQLNPPAIEVDVS